MVGLVGDIGAEVLADKGMPVSIVLAIELVLEMRCDLLDSMHFFEGVFRNCQDLSLHLWAYALVFNNWT